MTVENKHLARTLGSGGLDVYGTPAMITFMEETSLNAVQQFLPETSSTVGTVVNVRHLKSSPLGATITCEAVVKEVDGRRINFDVKAFDSAGDLIGEGTHERFVIDIERFMAKLAK